MRSAKALLELLSDFTLCRMLAEWPKFEAANEDFFFIILFWLLSLPYRAGSHDHGVLHLCL